MKMIDILNEDGRIVKGVNTTVDVGPDEIKKQAAKFGNKVDKDGHPPTLSKKVKGASTNVAFNLGLAEDAVDENFADGKVKESVNESPFADVDADVLKNLAMLKNALMPISPEDWSKVINKELEKAGYKWSNGKFIKENFANEITEEPRTLAPGTPMQDLVGDYGVFATFNLARLADYAKPGKEQDLKAVVQRATKSAKELEALKSDNEKLQFVHDMIKYIQPHMKAHMRDEEYEKYKPRIQKLVDLYKAAASSLKENFADGKVKGKSRPGRVKRAGASCNGSVTDLRKRAKNASGEKAKMLNWCANMKSGRKKK